MTAEPGRTYAQILNGRVHWIFTNQNLPKWADVADPSGPPNAYRLQVVDVTGAVPDVGDSYVNGEFEAPAAPQAPTLANVPCTPLYCRREVLTGAELLALTELSLATPQVAVWLGDFDASSYVLPADTGLAAGLAFLVTAQFFTQARADEILADITAGMPAEWGLPT